MKELNGEELMKAVIESKKEVRYEDLSEPCKKALDHYRGMLALLIDDKDFKYDFWYYKTFGNINPAPHKIIYGFCVYFGAKIKDVYKATRFAKQHNYWMA